MGGRGKPVVSQKRVAGRKVPPVVKKNFACSDFFPPASVRQGSGGRPPRGALDQAVALLGAEGRNVDDRQRVGRFEPQQAAGTHADQALAGLQDRQGTVQPFEIVDARVRQERQLPKMLTIRLRALLRRPGFSTTGSAACSWLGFRRDGAGRDHGLRGLGLLGRPLLLLGLGERDRLFLGLCIGLLEGGCVGRSA